MIFWVVAKTTSDFSEDEEREFEVEAADLQDAWDQANRQILGGWEQIVSVTRDQPDERRLAEEKDFLVNELGYEEGTELYLKNGEWVCLN